MRPQRVMVMIALAVSLATGCGGEAAPDERLPTTTAAVPGDDGSAASPVEKLAAGCANVIGVEVTPSSAGYRFAVAVRSADTGPEKYADLWEVRAPDGTVVGVRELLHDHVGEQPFTRTLDGVVIPESVTEVSVAARDSVEGFCGETMVVELPGR